MGDGPVGDESMGDGPVGDGPVGDGPVDDLAVQRLPIRLGQLLKLAGLVDSGGEAAAWLQAGEVSVNGTVETRRGRTVQAGDLVGFGRRSLRIVAG